MVSSNRLKVYCNDFDLLDTFLVTTVERIMFKYLLNSTDFDMSYVDDL